MKEKRFRKSLALKSAEARKRGDESVREELRRSETAPLKTNARQTRAIERGLSQPEEKGVNPGVRAGVRSLREAVLFDSDQPLEARIEVLSAGKLSIGQNKQLILRVLRLIGNRKEPEELRVSALDALRAATFSTRASADWRPFYLETLRGAAQEKANELADRALHILAQEQDPWALETVQQGLRQPKEARIAPLDAVQYLVPEDHGDHFDVLRDLARRKGGGDVRVEAIRGLASDPSARELLIELVDNAKESVAVRQAALLSLRILDPGAYRVCATRIVADTAENPNLRAASITAMRLDTNPRDSELAPVIQRISEEASSKVLRQSAQLYLPREE